MKTYKFRAETVTDVGIFMAAVLSRTDEGTIRYCVEHSVFELVVELASTLTLAELRELSKQVPDGHVIRETLNPVAEYTGDRV